MPQATSGRKRRGGRRRNATAEILTISILVALLVLFGVGLMLWGVETRLLVGPTPTPTATQRVPPTPTPDIRATNVAQDMATQIAYLVALQTRMPVDVATPQPPQTIPPTPDPAENDGEPPDTDPIEQNGVGDGVGDSVGSGENGEIPNGQVTPEQEPVIVIPDVGDGTGQESELPAVRTPITVNVPYVGGEQAAAPAEELTPTPMPIETPTPELIEIPTEVPTQTPTQTPVVLPTETPTEVPTATPTPTLPVVPPADSTPTPTSTPPVFTVSSLSGTIRNADSIARLGPSNLYTQTNVFGANAAVQLQGRNTSGEWVYVCCTNDGQNAWVRLAYARPGGNQLPAGAPEGADPNDVRWLGIQALSSSVTPVPTPTPIPAGDFPFYRFNRANQARPGSVPKPPVSFAWPGSSAQAGAGFSSPVIVMGNSVLAASLDNHLYSFDRGNGSQRWRYSVGRPMRMAPTALDSILYLAMEDGVIMALRDQGNQAVELWRATLPGPPVTPFTIHQNALYIVIGQPENYQLLTLDRSNGATLRTLAISGPILPYPAIGEQLIYVGGNVLRAFDATLATPFDYETVWAREDIVGITTPPLYSSGGVRALTELYVVDGNNRIYSLDAQTGVTKWVVEGGERATSLALNQGALFVGGDNYLKSLSRENGAQLWRAAIQGQVAGGPIVDDEFIVIANQGGLVQFLNAVTGNTAGGSSVLVNVPGSPAVSFPYVFIAGGDGRLYALQGNP